jgi:hypothetical protein
MRNANRIISVDRSKIRIDTTRRDRANLAKGNGIRPVLDAAHNGGRDRRISFELLPKMHAARPDISDTDCYVPCELALNDQIVLDVVGLSRAIVDRYSTVRVIAAED